MTFNTPSIKIVRVPTQPTLPLKETNTEEVLSVEAVLRSPRQTPSSPAPLLLGALVYLIIDDLGATFWPAVNITRLGLARGPLR